MMKAAFSLPAAVIAGLFAATAAAQGGNAGSTGFGTALGTVRDVQNALNQQWEGTPGRFAKGAMGTAGAALALSAAIDALTWQATVRADGRVRRGSTIGGTGDGKTTPSTATSTATSSN